MEIKIKSKIVFKNTKQGLWFFWAYLMSICLGDHREWFWRYSTMKPFWMVISSYINNIQIPHCFNALSYCQYCFSRNYWLKQKYLIRITIKDFCLLVFCFFFTLIQCKKLNNYRRCCHLIHKQVSNLWYNLLFYLRQNSQSIKVRDIF